MGWALARLTALHEGYGGVSDVVACGHSAVPRLRAILRRTDPSGVFEPRCRATAALAALGIHEELIASLQASHEVADPAARTGEEAVISTTARLLIGVRDARVFPLLFALGTRRPLAGITEALGASGRPQAIPICVRALREDDCRRAAMAALLAFGEAARPALVDAALGSPLEPETESVLRVRRAAVKLLVEIGVEPSQYEAIVALIGSDDDEISVHACRVCLDVAREGDCERLLSRLQALRPRLRTPLLEVAEMALRRRGALPKRCAG